MKFERMETGRDTRCKSKKKHEESDDDELCWRREEEGTRKTTTTLFVCSRIHILEWEKAYNMIFSYVLLRLVIIIFTHMLHFSASNKTVVNLEQKKKKVSRFNINSNQCALLKQFFFQYLPVTSHIALRKRTKKMVRRLKYRQLVSLMVLWLTLVWLRWFSCFNSSTRLRPVYKKKERKREWKNNYRRLFFMLRPSSRSVNFIFNIYIFSLTSKRNNGLNLNIFSSRCCCRWLKQIITVEVMYSILRQKWKKRK